jgi:hypothetical protein
VISYSAIATNLGLRCEWHPTPIAKELRPGQALIDYMRHLDYPTGMLRFLPAMALCLLLAHPVHAARPLVVDDAATADRGSIEIETALELLRENGTRNVAAPFAITYGLADDLEVGLDIGYQWERRRARGEPTEHVHGLLDTIVSLKWQFREQ